MTAKNRTALRLSARLLPLLFMALLSLLLAACGGGARELAPAPEGQTKLAPARSAPAVPAQRANPGLEDGSLSSPSLLRSSSFVDDDRLKTGSLFDNALPHNRVAAAGNSANFTPLTGGGSLKFNRCAFATWSFSLAGFTGDLDVLAKFTLAPPAGQGYIGLANFQTDRWDWFNLQPGVDQSFGDSAPYVKAGSGEVYVVVLQLSSLSTSTLDFVRVGGNVAPHVNSLDVAPGNQLATGGMATFSASAVDYDGVIASYDWDVDGQPGYEVVGGTEVQQFTYAAAGTYTPKVRVNDNDGAGTEFSGSAVEVMDIPNDPPVAALQSNKQGGGVPLSVNFDASGSTDSDGNITKYEWDWDGDGVYIANDDTLIPAASHVYTDPGDYNATVRVTDNLGATDTASVLIQAGVVTNQSPVALFRPDYYFTDAPLNVQFDAGTSSDPDGNVVKYEWDWNNDGTFEENGGGNPLASHSFPNPGAYPVSLRVTDDAGDSATVTRTVYSDNGSSGYDDIEPHDTKDSPQALPGLSLKDWDGRIGDPNPGPEDKDDWYSFSLEPYEAVTFDLIFLDADSDVDMKLFEADGVTELDSSTGTVDNEQVSYASSTGGNYLLRVYEFSSGVDNMANYTLNGTATYGSPPVADINSDVSTGDIPLTVNFDATASYDPGGGTIASYDWDLNGDDVYETTGDVDGLQAYTYVSIGSFTAKVRVHNNLGFTATDSMLITTADGQGNSPTADIQADVTTGNIALTVNFNASTSTAPNGGSITKYEWDLDGNGIFELDGGTTATTSATYYKVGSFNATVRVTSNLGITDTDSITITPTGTMDEVEPNNGTVSAQSLPLMPFSGFFADLGSGGNDGGTEDWYTFTLASDATVDVTMNLFDNFGDLDMRIYASDGTTEKGSSTGTDNNENINVALTAGTYYLKCYVYTGTTLPNGLGHGGYELVGSAN